MQTSCDKLLEVHNESHNRRSRTFEMIDNEESVI